MLVETKTLLEMYEIYNKYFSVDAVSNSIDSDGNFKSYTEEDRRKIINGAKMIISLFSIKQLIAATRVDDTYNKVSPAIVIFRRRPEILNALEASEIINVIRSFDAIFCDYIGFSLKILSKLRQEIDLYLEDISRLFKKINLTLPDNKFLLNTKTLKSILYTNDSGNRRRKVDDKLFIDKLFNVLNVRSSVNIPADVAEDLHNKFLGLYYALADYMLYCRLHFNFASRNYETSK